jgi:hypothetical protein
MLMHVDRWDLRFSHIQAGKSNEMSRDNDSMYIISNDDEFGQTQG